jgi:hypothetical protein
VPKPGKQVFGVKPPRPGCPRHQQCENTPTYSTDAVATTALIPLGGAGGVDLGTKRRQLSQIDDGSVES